ncbi:MAG: hypothetical protein Q9167_004495 [Letrouitia subvulpina]
MVRRAQLSARKPLQGVSHIDQRVSILRRRSEGEPLRRRMRREPPLIVEEGRQGAAVRVQIVADVGQPIQGGLVDQFEAGVAGLVFAVVVGEALVRWEMEGGEEGGEDSLTGGVAAVAEAGEGGGIVLQTTLRLFSK